MTDIAYHHGTIMDAAGSIDQAVSKMNNALDAVEQGMKPIETSWTAEAADAYRVRRDEWDKAALKITELLGQVKSALVKASENMSATDKNAAKYFIAG